MFSDEAYNSFLDFENTQNKLESFDFSFENIEFEPFQEERHEAQPSKIFEIEKVVDRDFPDTIDTSDSKGRKADGKRRGRKRFRNSDNDKPHHTKFKNDCRMAKIQAHYFTFLIKLLNLVIRKLKKDNNCFFCELEGKYKSNINKQNRASLNNKTIKEIIFEAPISGKIKKKDKNHNKDVLNLLKKEDQNILLNILDHNFLYFFVNIYYKNKKKYDLNSFGLDIEIDLTQKDAKIETFNDLLNKEKTLNLEYKNEMHKCAQNYFLLNNQKRE